MYFYSNDQGDPQEDYQNGNLFRRQLYVQQQHHYPTYPGFFPHPGDRQYFPSQPPPSTSSVAISKPPTPKPPTASEEPDSATKQRCTWTKVESMYLIKCYKVHYPVLNATKSTHGKKNVWENIKDDFVDGLRIEENVQTTKTLNQMKEKWRQLFDKYKQCADNNNSTGRDRQTFDFYDDIHDFMGSSDKANPRNIKQTSVVNRDDPEPTTAEELQITSETNAASKEDKRPHVKDDGIPKKKKKKGDSGNDALLTMIEAQEQSLKQSEENDEKILQALLKSQEDAQQRHQDFTIAVLGKLGDIFGKK